jgi:hypothetical protein
MMMLPGAAAIKPMIEPDELRNVLSEQRTVTRTALSIDTRGKIPS